MDWTAQIIWLSFGPIWQFFTRTCQKIQQTTMCYVPPTDNWHIYCSNITPMFTQVGGRGHGLDCPNCLAVFWADLAVFRSDINRQPCAMCHQHTTGTSTAEKSNQCTRRWMVEAMDWTAQIFQLVSGPIWQFFMRTCQKVTTDNHALCATNRQLAHLLQQILTSVHAGGW